MSIHRFRIVVLGIVLPVAVLGLITTTASAMPTAVTMTVKTVSTTVKATPAVTPTTPVPVSSKFKVVGVATHSKLNVRAKAGTGAKRIGQLGLGATVTATGKVATVASVVWNEITFGAGTGWVSSKYLTAV